MSKTPERLEIEHRSLIVAITSLGMGIFLISLVFQLQDEFWHIRVGGFVLPLVFFGGALVLAETNCIALDRTSGKVTMFRKQAFQTTRLELPLDHFKGLVLQDFWRSRGRMYERGVFLLFDDGNEAWQIPATSFYHDVAFTDLFRRPIYNQVNDWLEEKDEQIDSALVANFGPRWTLLDFVKAVYAWFTKGSS
ncbi:MAG: hypothetical protein AAGO57_07990 [Pseudomonadota bacterium]